MDGWNCKYRVVATAAALTLRLGAMTGWIMWALTTFFRSLGIVAEGMETIAQPLTLVDAPGAKPLRLDQGRIELVGLTHHYGRPSGGLEDVTTTILPGEKVVWSGGRGPENRPLSSSCCGFTTPSAGASTLTARTSPM